MVIRTLKNVFTHDRTSVEVLVTPSLKHCSNKYKLAREGINKEKDKVFFFFKFRMKSSSVERDEFSVVSGMVNENVLESDFEPLCDGTMRRRSLADLRLLEGM